MITGEDDCRPLGEDKLSDEDRVKNLLCLLSLVTHDIYDSTMTHENERLLRDALDILSRELVAVSGPERAVRASILLERWRTGGAL